LFLLDTNAASDIFKARSQSARRELEDAQANNTTVAISVLTKAEILFGLSKRPDAVRFREAFEAFCLYVEVLPWNDSAAHSYATLRTALLERNRTLDTMDLLIAAQAHALGAVIVTRDKAFLHLAGLVQVSDWASDLARKQ
jgi:tRNA(fMet)-specific endonuclease VapC